MPQIRPVRYLDSLGRPVDKASVYIFEVGKAWNDPNALLTVIDAENGAQTDNPFTTDENGFPVNTNGDRINPAVANTRWGLYAVNANGAVIYNMPVQLSDTFDTAGGGAGTVDAEFNNFSDPSTGVLAQDLAAFDFIFIKSQGGAGWENTTAGPVKPFYAHATGGAIGTPSTGTPDLFYDSQGKEWAMSDISDIPYNINPDNIQNLYDGYLYGIDTSSSDGDTVDVTAGKCADSTGALIIDVAAQNIDITQTITSGSGNRSGTYDADTTYYIFVVSEADGTNPKLAFDKSLTASGALADWGTQTGNTYTLYRLIGFALTDATPDIIAFQHVGSNWQLKTPTQDYSAASSTSRQSAALGSVPGGVSVFPNATMAVIFNTSAGTSSEYVLVTDLYQDDLTPSTSVFTMYLDEGSVNFVSNTVNIGTFKTDTSKQIGVRATGSNLLVRITTYGWRYER